MKLKQMAVIAALMMGAVACNSKTSAVGSTDARSTGKAATDLTAAPEEINANEIHATSYSVQSQSSTTRVHLASNVAIPKGFSLYASVLTGDGMRCVAGAVTDEDGMNQHPYVYVVSASGDSVGWAKALNVPEGFYESRATHCLRKGEFLYVLLQSDTQSQQSLSQTLLQVIKINSNDGTIEGSLDVVVPGAKGAYSAWVSKEGKNFQQINNELFITGQYRLLDANESKPFQISLKN